MIARLTILMVSLVLMAMQGNVLQSYSTTNFRIKYEKQNPIEDIRKLGGTLEAKYTEYQRRFGVSLHHRIDVYVFKSVIRFHSDAQSKLFDDGVFRDGKIYLISPGQLQKEMKLQPVVNRVVARALLDRIEFCPPWLRESYSLYLGNNLAQFGQPAKFEVSSFSDIGEEYSVVETQAGIKEVYAKLAVTGNFLVTRYGEKKVEAMFAQFRHGATLEEAFESAFDEKIADIEKAWVAALRASLKE